MKTIDVPVLTDSFVNRLSVRSVFSIRNAIKQEVGEPVRDFEEWFNRPRFVAERLADRLACAEECIRRGIDWPGYRRIVQQMEN